MEKTIVLNATGETITFIEPDGHSNGNVAMMIVTLPAHAEGPAMHRHVHQTEFFESLEGNLGIDYGDKSLVIKPGESFEVPKNTLHRFYSTDGSALKFRATFTPPLHIEYILTEIFESCNRKSSKDPSVFDACYVLRQAREEYFLGDVPIFVQKTIFPMTAFIGKVFGLIKAKSLSSGQS
jgi:mannose-6-phosphate isomerase-like protein (cupin superfamily)